MDTLYNVVDWPFLQEPLWRWAIFVGVMLGFLYAWNGVIEFMK